MPRWLKWTLGVAGGLILTLVAVVGVFILIFDWNWARDPLTQRIASATQRDVAIGNIQGHWAWRTRIVFRDVHFANAEWAKEPEMFSADEVAVTIDLRQLLRGRLVLPAIELRRPKLILERTNEGESNWSFGAKKAAETAAPENRFEMPLIGLLAVDDGAMVYRDPTAKLDFDSKISTVVGTGGEGKGQVRVDGKGSVQGDPFNVHLVGGSLLMLRETDVPYPLTVDMTAGPTQARISGHVEDPIKLEGLDLDVALKGPNLARLTKATGLPLPLTPPYDIKARLTRQDEAWLFNDLNGTMGHSDIQGTLRIDVAGERPQIHADLTSKNLDYRDVGSLVGIDPAKQEAAKKEQQKRDETAKAEAKQPQTDQPGSGGRASGTAAPKPKPEAAEPPPAQAQRRVLPDAPLAVEQVRKTDAVIKFRGEKVEAPNVPLSGVALDLDMKDGVLHLKPLSVGVAGGRTIATIKIDSTKELVHTDYDIKLQDYELGQFLGSAGLKDAGHGKIYGRIKLTAPGDTVQKSLANANGNIRFVMYGGEISTLAMELIGVDIGEALGLLAEGDKPAQVRCMAADMPVESGMMKINFFVFDTSDTLVEVQGTADLAGEQLDLRITAHPKDPSPLSARTPITVRGSFAKPSIGVDPKPLAARAAGAVALGALLTPLAAILAFIEPGLEKDSDCAKLVQEATPN
jgi:AsmA family protein